MVFYCYKKVVNMNKGFTLIEVLASIIIISLILVITIPSYLYVYNTVKTSNYNNKLNIVKHRAEDYGETVKDEIQENGCRQVLISDLIKKGYIKSDYNNKNALTNPLDNSDIKDELTICYCKSDNNIRAFIKDPFDYTKGYTKGDQVDYNGVVYECMSSYDYYNILNERTANANKKIDKHEEIVDAPCKGYYNNELNLCIVEGTTIDADYLINNFFKKIEC